MFKLFKIINLFGLDPLCGCKTLFTTLYLCHPVRNFIKNKKMPTLAVFDFDHTIINDNSDTAIIDLIGKKKIPQELKSLHKTDGWTSFMQGIFHLLHENNIDQSAITQYIENLAPIEGMPELIRALKSHNVDVIIVSDSNSYFIEKWLEKQQLADDVLKVFTNPAHFDANGLLTISKYHLQDTCKLSTKNLCKGQIMEEFIQQQNTNNGVVYEKIIYCGDGANDFCPIIRLKRNDLACVRDAYKCVEMIKKSQIGEIIEATKQKHTVHAEVLVWKNGFDILNRVKDFL